MNNTQKVLKNKHICEQATPNLGITQSSGLDHLSGYPFNVLTSFRLPSDKKIMQEKP